MSKKRWYVRRQLKGKRKLFPSEKLTLDGRYDRWSERETADVLNWAGVEQRPV